MQHKPVLTLSECETALAAAKLAAEGAGWRVTIAVVDDGGHLLGLRRLDGCAPIAAYVAIEKARTAALARRPSADFEEMINGGRLAFLSVPLVQATMTGGVPISLNGQVVGAVGVSGVKPDQDAVVAQAGVDALLG